MKELCVLEAVTEVVACDVTELFYLLRRKGVTFGLFLHFCLQLRTSKQFAALDFTIKGYFLRANKGQKCLLIVWLSLALSAPQRTGQLQSRMAEQGLTNILTTKRLESTRSRGNCKRSDVSKDDLEFGEKIKERRK